MIADRYEVVRPIGRGSFAQTLLALDTRENRQVALKVLHPRRAADWKSFDLFDREAAVLRTLHHPGIPAVYDVFRAQWDGSDAAFIAMEYIEGTSLAEHIAVQRALDPALLTGLLVEMLRVLEYLHTRVPPILHRDIKPANVILRPNGAPVLVDFGAVRNIFLGAEEDGSTIVGTYGYMPFEQLMGRATPASDLYALGATFLHLATGRPPSHFLTDEGGHLEVPPSLPGGRTFRATIARMLRAAPADRFASARAAQEVLLQDDAPASRRVEHLGRTGTRVRGAWLELPPPKLRTRTLIEELVAERAPTTMELMAAFVADGAPFTIIEKLKLGVAAVASAGVMPVVIWMLARARRDQLRHYFAHGSLTTGRIQRIDPEGDMVHYVFEADGVVQNGAHALLYAVPPQWQVGMLVQVLHIPGQDGHNVMLTGGVNH